MGAWKTGSSRKRPWEMVCIVSGFPSRISALQFEYAWQNPHRTRHIQGRISKSKTQSLHLYLGNLRLLLTSKSLFRWPLTLHIFDRQVLDTWNKNKHNCAELSSHMPILIDFRQVAEDKSTQPELVPLKRQSEKTSSSSQSQRTNIHEGDGLGGVKGLRISNDIYEPYFSQSASKMHDDHVCAICSEDILSSELHSFDTVMCSHSSCLEVYHTVCLANALLSSEDHETVDTKVLPYQGKCKSCMGTLNWGLLIRNASWRASGAPTTTAMISSTQQQEMLEDNDDVSELVISDSENSEVPSQMPKKRPRKKKVSSSDSETEDSMPIKTSRKSKGKAASSDSELTQPIKRGKEKAASSDSESTQPIKRGRKKREESLSSGSEAEVVAPKKRASKSKESLLEVDSQSSSMGSKHTAKKKSLKGETPDGSELEEMQTAKKRHRKIVDELDNMAQTKRKTKRLPSGGDAETSTKSVRKSPKAKSLLDSDSDDLVPAEKGRNNKTNEDTSSHLPVEVPKPVVKRGRKSKADLISELSDDNPNSESSESAKSQKAEKIADQTQKTARSRKNSSNGGVIPIKRRPGSVDSDGSGTIVNKRGPTNTAPKTTSKSITAFDILSDSSESSDLSM